MTSSPLELNSSDTIAEDASNAVEIQAICRDAASHQAWRLQKGRIVRLGRAPNDGWVVPWDRQISREHADLLWDGARLHVTCVEKARNPLVLNGMGYRKISLPAGGEFTIGTTRFRVIAELLDDSMTIDDSTSIVEHSLPAEQLAKVSFGDTERQMEILAELPAIIANSQSDRELAATLARLLLQAIPKAVGVAVAAFNMDFLPESDEGTEHLAQPVMMCTETRADFTGRFRPSRRLIMSTLRQQQSLIHVWNETEGPAVYTVTDGVGWAFCTPIRGESCRGWCLYIAGRDGELGLMMSTKSLEGELRFTELVAQFLGSIRQVRQLQDEKTRLSSFFSPKVVENLTGRDMASVLRPADCEVTVLFCDVRGFSRKAELLADDLHSLLACVRGALSVMVSNILGYDGTIADFQGDAALGFWGWPVRLKDGPIPACCAALDILRTFLLASAHPESPLYGFSVGIGIGHGHAIAGQVGTLQQAKVGVFGPVVNQTARLEGLTRQLAVPICIDQTTANWLLDGLPKEQGQLRRLARVRPKGMEASLLVYGLNLPRDDYARPGDSLTDEAIKRYEIALDLVIEGEWDQAQSLLTGVPDHDGPKQFLLRQMARTNHVPPDDWDGAFRLDTK